MFNGRHVTAVLSSPVHVLSAALNSAELLFITCCHCVYDRHSLSSSPPSLFPFNSHLGLRVALKPRATSFTPPFYILDIDTGCKSHPTGRDLSNGLDGADDDAFTLEQSFLRVLKKGLNEPRSIMCDIRSFSFLWEKPFLVGVIDEEELALSC